MSHNPMVVANARAAVDREQSGGAPCQTLEEVGPQWTFGGAAHPTGCTPCHFFCFARRGGCAQGRSCKFCHAAHYSRNQIRKAARGGRHSIDDSYWIGSDEAIDCASESQESMMHTGLDHSQIGASGCDTGVKHERHPAQTNRLDLSVFTDGGYQAASRWPQQSQRVSRVAGAITQVSKVPNAMAPHQRRQPIQTSGASSATFGMFSSDHASPYGQHASSYENAEGSRRPSAVGRAEQNYVASESMSGVGSPEHARVCTGSQGPVRPRLDDVSQDSFAFRNSEQSLCVGAGPTYPYRSSGLVRQQTPTCSSQEEDAQCLQQQAHGPRASQNNSSSTSLHLLPQEDAQGLQQGPQSSSSSMAPLLPGQEACPPGFGPGGKGNMQWVMVPVQVFVGYAVNGPASAASTTADWLQQLPLNTFSRQTTGFSSAASTTADRLQQLPLNTFSRQTTGFSSFEDEDILSNNEGAFSRQTSAANPSSF